MNPANICTLEGTVHGEPWTSYGRGQQGRVNFWLAVSRELTGERVELLQCGIEPRSGGEVLRLKDEIRDGRTVRLCACAHSLVDSDLPLTAQPPAVVFIAEECSFDGQELRNAHRRYHHGKAAAAGDVETAEIDELLETGGKR